MSRRAPSSGPHLPSAARRLLRDRARAGGVVLVAVALLAASGVRTGGTAALQTTLDESWRGLYDLLVTAPGTSADVAGLLSPTAITSLPQRMSAGDVAAVRAVDGVEVAAPIGEAVLSAAASGRLRFAVPIATGRTTPHPVAYRATLTWTTNDGLGERVVARTTVVLAVDDADLPEDRVLPVSDYEPGDTCTVDGVAVPVADNELCRTVHRQAVQVQTGDGWYSSFDVVDGYLTFGFEGEPALSPHVVLVDPVAERELLGEGGDFLAPLADASGASTAGALGLDDVDASVPVVPFLVADGADLPLTVRVDVENGFGDVQTGGDFGSWVLPDDVATAPGTPVGSATYDASALLRPLDADPVYVTWPGAPALTAQPTTPGWLAPISGAVTTGDLPAEPQAGAEDGPTVLSVAARTFLDAVTRTVRPTDQLILRESDGTVPGRESMFRTAGRTTTPDSSGGSVMPYAVIIGQFDPAAVAPDDSGLGYVPVGGVDPGASTLVTGPDGAAIDPVELGPSLSGFGIANAAAAAIGDIARAPEWGMTDPVSAIRVRVAGADGGYTDAARTAVQAVADRITDLGYTVTLAAGSSREDVRLLVDGYAFGSADPAVPQTVGTLGGVDQRWPRLGAAVTVEDAVTAATTAALWLAVTAAALLVGAAQAVAVPARRRDAAVLRTLGWRRRDVVRWFAAEEVVAVAVVLVAAAGAAALATSERLGGSDASARAAVGVGVAAVLLTSVCGVLAGVRTPREHGATPQGRRRAHRHALRQVRIGARSVSRFGVAQVRRHPVNAATMAVSTALVGTAAAALVAVVQAGSLAAGRTDLGLFAAGRGAVFQAATGAVGLVGGIVLLRLAQRTDQRIRSAQWATLRGIGWTRPEIARARTTELIAVLAPAVALVGGVVGFGADRLGVAEPVLLGTVALGTAVVAAGTLVVGARRKEQGR